jgi:hypothetical protein
MFVATTRETWSEFLNWITSVRLDGFAIDIDHPSDSLIIRNKNNGMITKTSRMVIESIDPTFRRQHIMDTVTQMATQTGSVSARGLLGAYTISAGGSAYITPPSSTNLPYNVFAVAEERYNQLEKEEAAKKLFSIKETLMLTAIKNDLHKLYHNQRTIMEQQTWNRDRMVIAGGCFASMIIGEEVKDYDVFLLDDEHNARIMHYMETKWRDIESVHIGSSGYMNNDRIKKTMFFEQSKCQYILTNFKTREELIEHFDFKHCRVSYDLMTEKLFITRETMDLILNKELDPSRPDDLPKQWRYEKFRERGWKERGHQDFVTI